MNFIEILTGIKAWTNNKLSGKYEKPSSGIPETDLKQDVQDLLGRAENSVAVKLLELDGNGAWFSPSLEPFILVAMNTNDISVYHVSASTTLTPEANIIRLVYSSTSSLLKFYYYEDNVVAWSDGEVSLYYCNLSGSYYDFEFFDGSLQRLEEDGVLLSIEEFATKSDLTAKYEKPSAGIPKSDLSSSAQSSLDNADSAYQKPSTGIPASDIADDVIPDVSQFITRTVNDLTNYYLKSETYTKDEVAALIGAIQQFHYEIYASLADVSSPASNVLYLIGPTGTGSDRYEEYVYANGAFTKIGDTSIDLSGYVTTQALNTALADYTTTSNLTQLLSQKENISNKTTSLSSESTDQQYPSAKAVYDFVMDKLGDIETLLAAI